ncbi:MAG: hypothetical protein J4N99_03475 [Chloroflexi bacterium]|nr:hypothetical protein [Chloroflexota bacterium]
MAIPTQKADDADIFFDHLAILRDYAEKIFVDGVELDHEHQAERDMRMANFMEVGERCEFTPQQLVRLLFAELFVP